MRVHHAMPAAMLFLAGCVTSVPSPRQSDTLLEATSEALRVEARLPTLSPGARVPLRVSIHNDRATTIAVADVLPETTYDRASRTLTVTAGLDEPGFAFLPRLLPVAPGVSREIAWTVAVPAGLEQPPHLVRLRLFFLTEGFSELLDIPERAIQDPALAERIFDAWIGRTRSITTAAVPLSWHGATETGDR